MARDRSWFGEDYRPISSRVGCIYVDDGGSPVIGIGTVELPTKSHPNKRGSAAHSTLRLENVLHVPSAVCNVVGGPIFDDHDV